ncbi:hypothetical protein AIOGIFDO_00226 [Candidatus Methanoperedenaceae archaeon GB37]|nr:hypothetical protein AIOGIFDO_00226 [Candidatus Methanoperedenaceae archaeon GB37]
MKRLHLTADKGAIKDFPKLPSLNFFYPQNVIGCDSIFITIPKYVLDY